MKMSQLLNEVNTLLAAVGVDAQIDADTDSPGHNVTLRVYVGRKHHTSPFYRGARTLDLAPGVDWE